MQCEEQAVGAVLSSATIDLSRAAVELFSIDKTATPNVTNNS